MPIRAWINFVRERRRFNRQVIPPCQFGNFPPCQFGNFESPVRGRISLATPVSEDARSVLKPRQALSFELHHHQRSSEAESGGAPFES
jgi:hypothetical protein